MKWVSRVLVLYTTGVPTLLGELGYFYKFKDKFTAIRSNMLVRLIYVILTIPSEDSCYICIGLTLWIITVWLRIDYVIEIPPTVPSLHPKSSILSILTLTPNLGLESMTGSVHVRIHVRNILFRGYNNEKCNSFCFSFLFPNFKYPGPVYSTLP